MRLAGGLECVGLESSVLNLSQTVPTRDEQVDPPESVGPRGMVVTGGRDISPVECKTAVGRGPGVVVRIDQQQAVAAVDDLEIVDADFVTGFALELFRRVLSGGDSRAGVAFSDAVIGEGVLGVVANEGDTGLVLEGVDPRADDPVSVTQCGRGDGDLASRVDGIGPEIATSRGNDVLRRGRGCRLLWVGGVVGIGPIACHRWSPGMGSRSTASWPATMISSWSDGATISTPSSSGCARVAAE